MIIYKNKMKNKAFTLVELLVTISIIALILTIAIFSFTNTREDSRNNKRISDIKQVQLALEKYYSDNKEYPSELTFGQALTGPGGKVYMSSLPNNPTPRDDGDCPDQEYEYSYNSENNSYLLNFCVSREISEIEQGLNHAYPTGISSQYGFKDRCLEFDGTNNMYIDINWIKNYIRYNSSWTIEFLVNFISLPTTDQSTLISLRDPDYISIAYVQENSTLPEETRTKIVSTLYKGPLDIYPNYLVGITPLINTWYHTALTSDGNGNFKLYINGILEDSKYLEDPSGGVNDPNIIGMQSWGSIYQRRLNGLIDEFRIWDYPRSEKQINNYMNQRLTGSETGLIAYYQLDEGTGSTAYDKTNNSNNGAIIGATWISP